MKPNEEGDPLLTTQQFRTMQQKWLRTISVRLVEYTFALGIIGSALLWFGAQFFVTVEVLAQTKHEVQAQFSESLYDLELRGIDRELRDLRLKLEFTEPSSNDARLLRAQITNLENEKQGLESD